MDWTSYRREHRRVLKVELKREVVVRIPEASQHIVRLRNSSDGYYELVRQLGHERVAHSLSLPVDESYGKRPAWCYRDDPLQLLETQKSKRV